MFKSFLSNSRFIDISKRSLVSSFGQPPEKSMTEILKGMSVKIDHSVSKKQKIVRKEKAMSQVSDTVFFQVVGNGALGTPKALAMITCNEIYMFNCGEGSQREMAESLTGMYGHLSNIMFTSRKWESIGGYLGMLLTSRTAGNSALKIHGPDLLNSFLRYLDKYRDVGGNQIKFDVEIHNQKMNGIYKDSNVNIESVLIEYDVKRGPLTPCPVKQTFFGNEKHPMHNICERVFNDTHGGMDNFVWDTANQDVGLNGAATQLYANENCNAYIIKIVGKPGKLNIKKCMDLGVTPGPNLGLLKDGKDVTLSDHNIVYSRDVLEMSDPGTTCLVLECSSIYHLDSLLASEKLSRTHLTSDSNFPTLRYVFHFTPSDVMSDPRYLKWMHSLESKNDNETPKHIILNESGRVNMYNDKYVTHVHKLRTVAPQLFPEFEFDNRSNVRSNCSTNSMVEAVKADRFYVKPSHDYVDKTPNSFGAHNTMFDREKVDKVLHGIPKVEDKNPEILIEKDVPSEEQDYPKVTILGSGSAIPSSYRNVSSYLIETAPDSFFMFDCGEGTFQQLYRKCGYDSEKVDKILKGLKGVFISHCHADHHIGLINILTQRQKAVEKDSSKSVNNIYIFTSYQHLSFLYISYYKVLNVMQNVVLIRNHHLCIDHTNFPTDFDFTDENIFFELTEKIEELKAWTPPMNEELYTSILKECNLTALAISKCLHCKRSYSISITTEVNNFKIVYSGDSRPTTQLVCLGKLTSNSCLDENNKGHLSSVDLLIHEASFDHTQWKSARMKKHSTSEEAVLIGHHMDAKHILLSHFSQRFIKFPNVLRAQNLTTLKDSSLLSNVDGAKLLERVGYGFDFMTVSPRTLRYMYPFSCVLPKAVAHITMKEAELAA